MVLRFGQFEVVEHGNNLRRSRVGRTQTIASANDERLVFDIVERRFHVEIERFALCAGFFRAVEHSNALHRLGNGGQQVLHRERTIEVDGNHTDLLALSRQVVDGLAGGFRGRTHQNDDVFSIFRAVVVEQMVFATCDFADFLHIIFHHFGHLVVGRVASLAMGEECLGILGRTACHRTLRRERTVAETLHILGVDEFCHVFLLHNFHFVVLVRSAESVEEVHKRNLRLQRGEVRHSRQVHHFLH